MELNFGFILISIVLIIIGIAIAWWILSKLYQRSTADSSFVRTGFLGGKVVVSGGAFVIPVLHEVTWVNMNTLRINLSHRDEDALITKDRMRVNVEADFFVRVIPQKDKVIAAARSYGGKTKSIDNMRSLLEARFNDAIRTAAAEQTMETLHEARGAFSQSIKNFADAGLEESGLFIDKVSISKLDQTSRDFFNPNNVFDAVGLTKLTAEIEDRKQRRNEIERDSQVAIQRKNLEAEQQLLELQKEEEYARMLQEREISIRRAQEQSRVTVESAEMNRESKVAEVNSTEAVEKARLSSDRSVKIERIKLEQQVKELEIDKSKDIELAETQRVKTLEIAKQITEIEIAEHSSKRNQAIAEAENSRAITVKAEESVITAREIIRAEREKSISMVSISKEIDAKSMGVIEQAKASKNAAILDGERIKMTAIAEAEAAKLKHDSSKHHYEVEANGRRALNEAENVMSVEAMSLRAKLAAIDQIQGVIRESSKPLENISEIKIMHVDGLGNSNSNSTQSEDKSSLSDQVMNSALKYRLQGPLVDALLDSAGIPSANPSSLLHPEGNKK